MAVDSPRRGPLPWKLLAVAFIFMAITAISVAITFAAIEVQSTVRSYVAGAGHWATARRDASSLIYRYGQSRDPEYLRRFDEVMRVPQGNREARVEMQKPDFDYATAATRLMESGHHAHDVPSLVRFFRCCNLMPRARQLVDLWEQGDRNVREMQGFALRLKSEFGIGLPSRRQQRSLFAVPTPTAAGWH